MRAGSLNRTVTLQEKGTITRTAYGSEVITWTTVATPRANIQPLRGAERIEAAQVSSQFSHRVRIRYRATAVRPGMRIRYVDAVLGERILEIVSVANVSERNREIELMCEELVDA